MHVVWAEWMLRSDLARGMDRFIFFIFPLIFFMRRPEMKVVLSRASSGSSHTFWLLSASESFSYEASNPQDVSDTDGQISSGRCNILPLREVARHKCNLDWLLAESNLLCSIPGVTDSGLPFVQMEREIYFLWSLFSPSSRIFSRPSWENISKPAERDRTRARPFSDSLAFRLTFYTSCLSAFTPTNGQLEVDFTDSITIGFSASHCSSRV